MDITTYNINEIDLFKQINPCSVPLIKLNLSLKDIHKNVGCHKENENSSAQTGSLKKYVKNHQEGRRNHQCYFCDKYFFTSQHLNNHIKTVHEDKRDHKCEHCGK